LIIETFLNSQEAEIEAKTEFQTPRSE